MEHKLIDYMDSKICDVCGGMDESLTTHCRGEKLNFIMIQMIHSGQADYVNGEWIRPNIVRDLRFTI